MFEKPWAKTIKPFVAIPIYKPPILFLDEHGIVLNIFFNKKLFFHNKEKNKFSMPRKTYFLPQKGIDIFANIFFCQTWPANVVFSPKSITHAWNFFLIMIY